MAKFSVPKDEKLRKKGEGKEINRSSHLNTDQPHKDWYNPTQMGKQRNQPHFVMRSGKKPKESFRHK